MSEHRLQFWQSLTSLAKKKFARSIVCSRDPSRADVVRPLAGRSALGRALSLSDLVSKICTGRPAWAAQLSICRSNSCSGWRISISNTSPQDFDASASIRPDVYPTRASSQWALWRSHSREDPPDACHARSKKLISWVRPGVLLVLASPRMRVSVFMALDLPAFERPAKATSQPLSAGHCLSEGALVKNVTRL